MTADLRVCVLTAAVLATACLSPARAEAPSAVGPEQQLPSEAQSVVEQAVAVDPRDPRRVVVAAMEVESHRLVDQVIDGVRPRSRVWTSLDGGRSYVRGGLLPYAPSQPDYNSNDPTLAWGPDGTLHAAYLGGDWPRPAAGRNGLWAARSVDGGRSWQGRLVLANTYVGAGCSGADFPQIAAGPAGGATWIVYQHVTRDDCALGGRLDVRVLASRDGGRSWSAPRPLSSDVSYTPRATVTADGSLAVVYLEQSAQRGPADGAACGKVYEALVLAVISPGGRTTRTVLDPQLCTALPGMGQPGKTYVTPNVPSVAYDAATGRVVVVATSVPPAGVGGRLDVYSTADRGRTIQKTTPVAGGPHDAPFMAAAAAGAGQVAVGYLAGRPGGLYLPSLVSSDDGGQSWSEPAVVASAPSNGNGRPDVLIDRFGIGHYLGVAVGGDGSAYLAWPDLRAGGEPDLVRTFVRRVALP